ncbi:MAG: hypothetical protein JKY56_14800 [Kofleriaceae bacterium]|nr:hypothetical protein [Kofleriaceae bacterium]
MTVVVDTFGLIPVGKWLYLDMQFDGSTVNASLLDGPNTVAQLSYNLGVSPIGSPGLLGNGADFDGLTGCAILPEQDECALGIDECDENAICNDLLGGYECVCESGYIGDGFTCTDENECETGTHSCSADAICTNTVGSFTCECGPGFVGDGIVCTDIDECTTGQFECSSDATCNNTPGSYECVCNEGYEGNGVTCDDIDECAIGTDDCSEFGVCENTPGSFTCECSAGYEGDGRTCLDVDECALGLDSCHDAATCHNQEGSYSCECNGGWQGDGFECNDIDECDLGTDACADNAECQNLPGFYICTCTAGHSGDGVSCDDIDECATGTDSCSEFASCSNTDGSFTCACLPGFEGGGTTCTDINECDTSEFICGTNAVCQNTQGSFECDCQNGFQGDGTTCTDIDECANGNNDCTGPHIGCSNTEGSYTCDCDNGFTDDSGSCVDIDECATNAFSCPSESVCANNSGGYDCECQLGYEVEGSQCIDATTGVQSVGAGDLHTCVLMDEGVVKCWGIGLNGRTGHANTATIGDNEAASAASIVNLTTTPAVQLAVGGAHNCILLDDGHVRCWGNGADGRLGYENHEDIGDDEDPIDAGNLPLVGKAVRLALGQKHSCALLENGSVRCWGSNTYGQLGSGPTIFPVDYTQAVDLGAPAIDLVAGDFHTCAILDNGEVYCRGLGSMGRLGYGNTNSVGLLQTPREAGPVSIGGTATAIAAGQNHSCAILSDSTMRCWGRGADGVLGNQGTSNIGDNELPSDTPVLSIDNTLISVSAGGSHTCILTGSGQVQCFGKGQDGQLGYGNATNIGDNETPSSAGYVDVGNVVEIDAGNKHTCAVLSSGAVRCWGNSSLGQLGYGNTLNIGDTETPASAGDIDL